MRRPEIFFYGAQSAREFRSWGWSKIKNPGQLSCLLGGYHGDGSVPAVLCWLPQFTKRSVQHSMLPMPLTTLGAVGRVSTTDSPTIRPPFLVPEKTGGLAWSGDRLSHCGLFSVVDDSWRSEQAFRPSQRLAPWSPLSLPAQAPETCPSGDPLDSKPRPSLLYNRCMSLADVSRSGPGAI